MLSCLGREQAIPPVVIAAEFLRVPMLAIVCRCVMLLLGADKLIAETDRGEFISSHSPCEDLSFPRVRRADYANGSNEYSTQTLYIHPRD